MHCLDHARGRRPSFRRSSVNFEIDYGSNSYKTSVVKAYRRADLALLSTPVGLSIPGLRTSPNMPTPGSDLELLGYGMTPSLNSTHERVRLVGASRIDGLVGNATIIGDLTAQGFPDVTAPIINLDSAVKPGDSGGPLIDDNGLVVGIANGNLLEGQLPISWAFPASEITQLLSSTEEVPTSGNSFDVLTTADTVGPASTHPPISCGVGTFSWYGKQTFQRLVATADAFAAPHIALVQRFAASVNRVLSPGEEYDVYVDSVSGAGFIVPSGFSLSMSGTDCVAIDPANQLEMRFDLESAPSFGMTGALAAAFSARMLKLGEGLQANPAFSTPPISRGDGMVIQRYAYAFGMPYSPSPPTEGHLTLAWRRGIMLEVSMRTLVPNLAMDPTSKIFESVVAVYAAMFAL